ncbi:MAG: dihydrofolate reductase [Chitinophagaceae bacterium]
MRISLIVAVSTNEAIGNKGQLLWHLPNDLKFFKNTTWAMPVIMGRKTFESVGKPLPGRTNIVITNQEGWIAPGVETAIGIENALNKANFLATNEIFIIGGGHVYQQSLHLAQRVYLTRVHTHIEDADTFFPSLRPDEWYLSFQKNMAKDKKHAFDYSIEIWDKKPKVSVYSVE